MSDAVCSGIASAVRGHTVFLLYMTVKYRTKTTQTGGSVLRFMEMKL